MDQGHPHPTPAARLRTLLDDAREASRCEVMPACHDALSARLIERAGFRVAFMSGFAVSASGLALPDAGLISYGEQLSVGQNICAAIDTRRLLVIGDGDTGFGGSGNVRRTIEGYAKAGFAGVSIEDQVYPKRCAYSGGVAVVPREEAVARVRCAIAARDEMRRRSGLDLVLVARTDCRRAEEDLDEVLWRCRAFAALGADVVYAEGLAPDELRRLCVSLGPTVHTMLAQVERPGVTLISQTEAAALGCRLSLFGLTVLSAAVSAMTRALEAMASGGHPSTGVLCDFGELKALVGFDALDAWEEEHQACPAVGQDGAAE